MFKAYSSLGSLVRTTLVQIVLGAAVVIAVEASLVAASRNFASLDLRVLGLWLVVTGVLLLLGASLTLLGPMPHTGFRAGTQRVLVSSGTRSLWDLTKSPGLHASPSKVIVALGMGGVLFVLGLVLAVL